MMITTIYTLQKNEKSFVGVLFFVGGGVLFFFFAKIVMRFPKLYVAFIVDLSHLWVLSLVLQHHSHVQTGGPRLACPLPERHAQVFPKTRSDLVTFLCKSMKAPQGQQNKGPVALLSLPGLSLCPKKSLLLHSPPLIAPG